MLFELILEEERKEHLHHLAILGTVSAFFGFFLAYIFLPTQIGVLSTVFASLPLVYPLMARIHAREKEGAPYYREIKEYASLFFGEVLGFFILGIVFTNEFALQITRFNQHLARLEITGYATHTTCFLCILLNNMFLFGGIIIVSMLIGSAGAFILTWNASVLGVFLAILTEQLSGGLKTKLLGTEKIPGPLLYAPHTTLEMSGFIIAGIAGSLMSAALYRRHFDVKTWKNYTKLVSIGLLLILAGAIVETI
ncbi:MAG: hypothetical protein ABEI78_02075 [Candidatus Nanohaloarchaea archaeon]